MVYGRNPASSIKIEPSNLCPCPQSKDKEKDNYMKNNTKETSPQGRSKGDFNLHKTVDK